MSLITSVERLTKVNCRKVLQTLKLITEMNNAKLTRPNILHTQDTLETVT